MPDPVHILGAETITSLGLGREVTYSAMMAGQCGVGSLQRFPHGKYKTNVAGELPASIIDQLGHGTEAGETSLAFRLALTVGRRALDEVEPGASRDADRLGLIVSAAKSHVHDLEGAVGDQARLLRPALDPSHIADCLAKALAVRGPRMVVSSACAASLVAIIQAVRWLERGQAKTVLVVGVDVLSDFALSGFSSLGALSPRPCRPYDADRDGLSLGEGAGAVVLSLHRGGHRSLGRICGWSITNDASHVVSPSETADGMVRALQLCLSIARLQTSQIGYINGHGTATPKNDAMEAVALNRVFGHRIPPVASMKGFFGHTLGAAGVIEAIMCLHVLRDRTAPASLGFASMGVDPPIPVLTGATPIVGLTHALTVKTGFGGVCAALALERDDD